MAAGAITTLALAPFDIWPLALLAVGLFYARAARPEPAPGTGPRLVLTVSACSAPAPVGSTYSIHHLWRRFGVAGWFPDAAVHRRHCLFFALPAWLWARWLRRNEAPLADALAFAALWVGQEVFRGWFLTGFPWLYSGYSQLDGPLAGLAPVGGMWLVSFVLALTAALIYNAPRLMQIRPQRFCRGRPAVAGWAVGGRYCAQGPCLDQPVRRAAERRGDSGQRRTKHEMGPGTAQRTIGAVPRLEFPLQTGWTC